MAADYDEREKENEAIRFFIHDIGGPAMIRRMGSSFGIVGFIFR
jgi:hypothetical protein